MGEDMESKRGFEATARGISAETPAYAQTQDARTRKAHAGSQEPAAQPLEETDAPEAARQPHEEAGASMPQQYTETGVAPTWQRTDASAPAWYETHANDQNSMPQDQASDDGFAAAGYQPTVGEQNSSVPNAQAERPAFVRQRAPHRTQPSVDDLQIDDAYGKSFNHDTSYTLSRRPMAGSTYRRSRSSVSRAQKELRYGQYLSVPKGSHEIFGKRERIRRRQIAVAVIAIVAIVVVIAIFLSMPR